MIEDVDHEVLFSGAPLMLGEIHWYLLKADTEMDNLCHTKEKGPMLASQISTGFGKKVGGDEIHWWVFEREENIEELLEKTGKTLSSAAEKLKKDSLTLKNISRPESYSDLISKINDFTDAHEEEIKILFDYIVWLHQKDVLAPIILFNTRVWAATRLGDLSFKITATDIEDDFDNVKKCTELVLGLQSNYAGSHVHTIDAVYLKIHSEIAQDLDPEDYHGEVPVSKDRVLDQTYHTILDEIAIYFECLRNMFRNIIKDIQKYNAQTQLLYRDTFWQDFVAKVMAKPVERQLWDFKETLSMWDNNNSKKREEAKIKLCKYISAFANSNGGVLIIGVTDEPPRNIKGISDIESKIKTTKSVIKKYIGTDFVTNFIHFQPIVMKGISGKDVDCLIIAVPQTKKPVSVKDGSEQLYRLRLGTGMEPVDLKDIKKTKINVLNDNYDFILDFYKILHDR